MSFHGGFFGVCLAVIDTVDIMDTAIVCSDLIALATPPGLFFGRLVNFINAFGVGQPICPGV